VCDERTDPTSSKFDAGTALTTVGTGGLNYAGEAIYEAQKDPVSDAWGDLTGEDEQEALEESLAAQEEAQKQQIAFLREQYGDLQEQLAPYREVGTEFLPQLTEMLSPEARSSFIQDYLQGDEFGAIQDQATNQLLQSGAATGSLRSSGTQDRIARESMLLANQMGNQAYQNALGNLTQGTNIGFQTFGPTLQAQTALNQGTQAGLANIANLQLGAASMNQGGLLGQLAPFAPAFGAYLGAG